MCDCSHNTCRAIRTLSMWVTHVLTTTLYMYAILSYQFQLLGRLLDDLDTITCHAYKLILWPVYNLSWPPHKLQDLCFKFTLQTLAYLTLSACPLSEQLVVKRVERFLSWPRHERIHILTTYMCIRCLPCIDVTLPIDMCTIFKILVTHSHQVSCAPLTQIILLRLGIFIIMYNIPIPWKVISTWPSHMIEMSDGCRNWTERLRRERALSWPLD